MTSTTAKPNLSLCFGQYRAQSVAYALDFCLSCPKLKACVRRTWGVDQPPPRRRSQRRTSARGTGRRPPWPSLTDGSAT